MEEPTQEQAGEPEPVNDQERAHQQEGFALIFLESGSRAWSRERPKLMRAALALAKQRRRRREKSKRKRFLEEGLLK